MLCETEKDPHKRSLRTADDVLRRVREINQLVEIFMAGHRPAVVCIEGYSQPRDAAAAVKLAAGWTAAICASEVEPTLFSPSEIKHKATGKKGATKAEVEAAIIRLHPELPSLIKQARASAKAKREHLYDAAGAVLCALDHPVVQALRRNWRHKEGKRGIDLG